MNDWLGCIDFLYQHAACSLHRLALNPLGVRTRGSMKLESLKASSLLFFTWLLACRNSRPCSTCHRVSINECFTYLVMLPTLTWPHECWKIRCPDSPQDTIAFLSSGQVCKQGCSCSFLSHALFISLPHTHRRNTKHPILSFHHHHHYYPLAYSTSRLSRHLFG